MLDDQFDWVIHKQLLIEQRALKEYEEKRYLALEKAHNGKLDKRKLDQINKLDKQTNKPNLKLLQQNGAFGSPIKAKMTEQKKREETRKALKEEAERNRVETKLKNKAKIEQLIESEMEAARKPKIVPIISNVFLEDMGDAPSLGQEMEEVESPDFD